jgi:receptor tyrosine kinase-like orphan receptor 1
MRPVAGAVALLLLTVAWARGQETTGLPEEAGEGEEEARGTEPPPPGLVLLRGLKKTTRDAGGSLKLRCEADGPLPATEFRWYKNEAPVLVEKGRVRIKTEVRDSPQWSLLRITELETLDTAFYRCEASNGIDTVRSDAIVRVNLGSLGTLPRSFPPLQPGAFPGMSGQPTNVEFEGRSPDLGEGGGGRAKGDSHLSDTMLKRLEQGNPSLVPNEASGFCQPYYGSVCAKYIGANFIYISEGLSQDHIEKKLAGVLPVIKASPDMTSDCAEYALPSICLSTFAICDKKKQKPRKICRDECEILERKVCRAELAIARTHPLLGHQMVLPDCEALPPVGSPQATDCVKLGFPVGERLVQPHSCYKDAGEDYRGTASTTRSGYSCVPWGHHQQELPVMDHLQLIGGHNYCRNPPGALHEAEPWCFTNDDLVTREVCGLQRCAFFNMWLYVAVPAISAFAILGLSIGLCCMRRRGPPAKPLIVPAGSLGRNFGGQQAGTTGTMQMEPLLTARQQQQKN